MRGSAWRFQWTCPGFRSRRPLGRGRIALVCRFFRPLRLAPSSAGYAVEVCTWSVFFDDTVKAKAWQTSTMTSIILASPCGDRENYAGVIRVQHAPHRTTNAVHRRLRFHRRRRFLQVHRLGEDDRILVESLGDNGHHGCEEDVEQ